MTLCYHETGEFAYSFDGLLLDRDKWEQVSVEHASGFELYVRAKEEFLLAKELEDKSALKTILGLLELALQRGLDRYPNQQALVYRMMGEINEMLGEPVAALSLYETALSLDPKVGLKRKVAAMKLARA